MTVYLNGTRLNVLIMGSESEVLDETLDSASFAFINSSPDPIAPMQRVEIGHEDNSSSYFITISDSVEPYTPTSGLYKHEVTCAESTRILSKRMLRNSVFSQPPYPRKGKTTLTALPDVEIVTHGRYHFSLIGTGTTRGFVSKKLSIPSGEKCSRAYVKLTTQFFFGAINDTAYNTTGKIKMFKNSSEFANFQSDRTELLNEGKARLYWTLNGDDDDEEITFDTSIYNGEFDSPRIKELINQGATNIYIKTTTDRPLYYAGVDGFLDPNDPDGQETHLLGWNVCFEIIAETYIHTAYSILEEIKNRSEQRHRVRKYASNGTSSLQWFTRDSLFLLPASGDLYNLLNNTIAPNMTFTQCSVYEAVAEVFRLFDAIFTMDENGTLGITYFNEKTGTANPSVIAKNSAIGEERFINGLMCYYQDARIKTDFPKGQRVYAPVSSKQIGVVAENDRVFRVSSPIHDIISFKQLAKISIFNGSVGYMAFDGYEIDMTERLYEQSIWSSTLDVSDLPSEYDSNDFSHQADSITYTKNDKYIDLSLSYSDSWGLYRKNLVNATKASLSLCLGVSRVTSFSPELLPNSQNSDTSYDWSIPYFKVEYHSSANGVFKVESYANKYDGEMPIDQASGSIDLGKAGLNILGLSFRMGEPTLNVTHRATSWEDRIQKGFVLTYQGEQWTANNCRYTCIGDDLYQGQVSFIKDYNELSKNKKILREKRLSSVSDELTTKSEEIITDFCYVFDNQTDLNLHLSIVASCWSLSAFGKAMANSFNVSTNLTTLNDVSLYWYDYDTATGHRFFLPSYRYGAGDVICFEMSYDDPMVASLQFSVSSGWFGSNQYYSKYVLYTDAQGYLEEPTISLQIDDVETFNANFPVLPSVSSSEWAFQIPQLQTNKQPNEVFALNFQTAFIPFHPKKVIIGKAFIEDNFFVNGVMKERALRFYYSDTEEYSVLDTKAMGTLVNEAQSVVYQAYNKYFSLAFGGSPMAGHKSWAVCDENDNILFACNSSDNVLYFTLKVSRI